MKSSRCVCGCGCEMFMKVHTIDFITKEGSWAKLLNRLNRLFNRKVSSYEVYYSGSNVAYKCADCGMLIKYTQDFIYQENSNETV